MKLAIDCGNTLLKAGLFQDNKLFKIKKFPVHDLTEFIEFIQSVNYRSIILSTVISLPNEIYQIFSEKNQFLLELNNHTALPFQNKYSSPETLGNDRLSAVAGALYLFKTTPILAVNCGSCITYNLLENPGVFTGGAISPGMMMRFRALNNFTANLPLTKPNKPTGLTGTTTEENIQNGVITGMLCEIEGMVSRYQNKNPGLKVVMGGGDADFLHQQLNIDVSIEENLNLYGLKIILDHNEH